MSLSPAMCVESDFPSSLPAWEIGPPAWSGDAPPCDASPGDVLPEDRSGRLSGFDDDEEESGFDDDDDIVPDLGDAPVVEEEDDEFDEEDFDDDFDDDFESYEYEEFQFEGVEEIPEKDDAELEEALEEELDAPKPPKGKGLEGDEEEEIEEEE